MTRFIGPKPKNEKILKNIGMRHNFSEAPGDELNFLLTFNIHITVITDCR